MINHSKKDFKNQKEERIAQMIFQKKKENFNFVKIDESELSETEKGAGGFGSTGIYNKEFLLYIFLESKS